MTRGSGGLLALGVLLMAGFITPAVLIGMAWTGGQAELTGPSCGSSVQLASASAKGRLDTRQRAHAGTIVAVGNRLGIPRKGLVVALAVANQESGFRNYANDGQGGDLHSSQAGIAASLNRPHDAVGTDHGSLGIFQQQWPWWGSMSELMDPATSAARFYQALLQVPGWEEMSVTEAGQAVQRSAFPDAYADDVPVALELLGLDPVDAAASVNAVASIPDECTEAAAFTGRVTFPLQPESGYVDQENFGDSGSHWSAEHTGTDFSVSCGTAVLAATDGTAVVRTDQSWSGRWLVQITTGPGGLTTWYGHMQRVSVQNGESVHAGQQIGAVGSEGNSTGCHLHFEVHPDGDADDAIDPTGWLKQRVGDSVAAASYESPTTTPTVVTASIDAALSRPRARADIQRLLGYEPHVLMLQGVGTRDVASIAAGAAGNWGVWQPRDQGTGSAMVWRSENYELIAKGAQSPGIAWVLLRGRDGRMLPLVSLQMSQASASRVVELARAFENEGFYPLIGGDWGAPLDRPRTDGMVGQVLRSLRYGTNWLGGKACPKTERRGGRVDGFVYDPSKASTHSHGCLPWGNSDHRPVWMALDATTTP